MRAHERSDGTEGDRRQNERGCESPPEDKAPTQAIKDLFRQWDKLRLHAETLLATGVDRLLLRLRLTLISVVLAIVACFVVVTAAVVGTILLIHGAADLLGELLGGPAAGDLIVATATLGCLVVGGWVALSSTRKVRRETRKRYVLLQDRKPVEPTGEPASTNGRGPWRG